MRLESVLTSSPKRPRKYPAAAAVSEVQASAASRKLRRKIQDKFALAMIVLATLGTVGMLGWILFHIISNGLSHIDWTFLTSDYARTDADSGIWPMIVSTLYMVGLSLGIAAPVGIMAAIYLTEFARPGSKLVKVVRFATESLAGIPSIIYGLFGLTLFVSTMKLGFSILAGALTLSILILPVIIRTTEESLLSVPQSWRDSSYALGASRVYTIWHLVLPNALPGIVGSIILCIGRIIGESAPVFLTAGMVARIPDSVFDSGRTLTVHLYKLTQELFSISDWDQAYATATVLIILVLSLNIVTRVIASRFRKHKP
ncbi:phosphate ABC transporter permease PstA [Parendozoicomonas haliclonae]|uniref:Phosphate transport system permease protein PstA n=1 Tax=Parendozoicomonas haliclonae TaxID=1960125 RepID=A0A1X7AFA9_9GAMM|nr:phosphate ABC transporter permease PstA [Parendozoicomonas haliclonae]SMA37373.1 Phosphate transport system permease protein PstA [Parendozoicomonas haliclonae]